MSGFFDGFRWIRILILLALSAGFLLLFRNFRLIAFCADLLKQTKQYMDETARKRLLDNRQMLLSMQQEHSLWFKLDRQLNYSGWKQRMKWLTVESWLAANIVVFSGTFIIGLIHGGIPEALVLMGLTGLAEGIAFLSGKAVCNRAVNGNLMKFLDFLGNYSITAGEITSVFESVSRYVDNPLKRVLEECSYEAQTTGDTAMALLAMAEKIEHPKFKELVRNMEISLRYSADFSVLVQNSRRGMREYLRNGVERKSLLREAVINMMMLLGLSGLIFVTVDGMIEKSIWQVLFQTTPGRMGLGLLAFIFLLFGRQIYKSQH